MNTLNTLPDGFLQRVRPAAFTVPELISLVIADRGRPTSLEEVSERLVTLGVFRSVASLRKAWHASPGLRKRQDGRLELIVDEGELSSWGFLVHKVRNHLGLVPVPPHPPARARSPVDDLTPVNWQEIVHGLRERIPSSLSTRRLLALVVEAHGGELNVAPAIERLREIRAKVSEEEIRRSIQGRSGPIVLEAGKLVLRPEDSALQAARRLIRERIALALDREEQSRRAHEATARWRKRTEPEREESRSRYRSGRKVVIRCLFTGERLAAASAFEPDRAEFQDFTKSQELLSTLQKSDYVFGIDPRSDLERLRFEPGARHVVDLGPPVKTVQLNRRGRQLKVTPVIIIRSTLGWSRPLGDPSQLLKYHRGGQMSKLFVRLRSDLKSLWRLYEYGCLHGYVRLRWGFLDEVRGVGWNVGRLPMLWEVCQEAVATGRTLEVALGSAPGWEEPWKRAVRLRVVESDYHSCRVEVPRSGTGWVPYQDIYAVRAAATGEDSKIG